MKSILIIGASGFVGKNLFEYLNAQKDKYIVFAPRSSELDATDKDKVKVYLENRYFDVVINAAVHNPATNPQRKCDEVLNNTLRIFYVFEKYSHLYGKMIYFGSGAEYDKSKELKSVSEEMIGLEIPKDDYGFAKYIINETIRKSENIYNLRLFGVYGKYEHFKSKFISNICCKAVHDIHFSLRQNVYFDYLYIDDLCGIVEWFIDNKPKHKDYNVVSGKRIDLLSLAQKTIKITKKDLSIFVCKEGLGNEYTASNERLLKEIGDFKFTQIESGIKSLYEWYCMNKDKIDIYELLY
ncbi:MAG: NAD(P)-dependent oxidoreductase [Clostridiaceae bacterium]|nr:NAD(P)-dependent oxidoreductase [Clostridiaceae bacterium]